MFGRKNYCPICGMQVNKEMDIQRFGKHFCSQGHADQYVQAMQGSGQSLGVANTGQSGNSSGGCC